MPVLVDELRTEIEVRDPADPAAEPAAGDPRWALADRARKQQRDDRWRRDRTRAEGLDD